VDEFFKLTNKGVFVDFNGLKNSEFEEATRLDVVENKAGRFMSVSVLLHVAMLASVTLMSVPPIEFTKNEIVEFEVESNTAAIEAIPEGAPIPETKGAAPAELPVKAFTPQAKSAAPATTASAPRAAAPAAAMVADTLDDIQTPDLEAADAGETPIAPLDEKDLAEDFEKVDQAQHRVLVLAKKSLDEDTDKATAEGNEALHEIEKENQAEAKALTEANEKRRAQDTAAIAAAQSAEKAARLAALKATSAQESQGTADEGEGSGNGGSPKPTKEVAGIPGGVRSLEQLRRMPGNKLPQYDKAERLARQEGRAIFYAYVNKDGTLSQFKLGESSGHRNLDGKTLAALKNWKFYPGQEGWVEMPFKWALSGEAMEAGGQLRK
jgi:TonB family protein